MVTMEKAVSASFATIGNQLKKSVANVSLGVPQTSANQDDPPPTIFNSKETGSTRSSMSNFAIPPIGAKKGDPKTKLPQTKPSGVFR